MQRSIAANLVSYMYLCKRSADECLIFPKEVKTIEHACLLYTTPFSVYTSAQLGTVCLMATSCLTCTDINFYDRFIATPDIICN